MQSEQKILLKTPHNIILEDRNRLSVSGVKDVDTFDDQVVILLTNMGELTIKGRNIHINNLSIETGDLSLTGEIIAMYYNDIVENSKRNIFKKIFR